MVDGEIALWRAVVLQAMRDISDKSLSAKVRGKARKWFCTRSLDFLTVCDLADVDPHDVKKEVLEVNDEKEITF